MFGGAPHCPDCTRVLDPSWIDPGFRLRQTSFDVSATYDGCVVVSEAFVTACDGVDGARFVPIESSPGFSTLDVERVVRLERFDSHVREGPTCQECGGPRYVSQKGPLRLLEDEILEPGFSRTDLSFGDTADFGPEQPIWIRPRLLVDEDTGRALKAAGLWGVHFIQHP